MKTLTFRYCPFLLMFFALFSCGEDEDDGGITSPPAAQLELIMDGERAWRVASVDSDKPLDFDGVVTTDWYSQMDPCLNDDPIVITYEAYDEQIGPDVLNLEVYSAEGLKCSQYEAPEEYTALGHSLEPLKRYKITSVSSVHSHLYGFTIFVVQEEIWEEMTFSVDSVTYATTKVIDDETYPGARHLSAHGLVSLRSILFFHPSCDHVPGWFLPTGESILTSLLIMPMNAKESKQVPIRDILAHHGHHPLKETKGQTELWYRLPFW